MHLRCIRCRLDFQMPTRDVDRELATTGYIEALPLNRPEIQNDA